MPASSKAFAATVAVLASSASADFASIPMHHATRGSGPFYFGTHATAHFNSIASNPATSHVELPGNGSDVPTGGSVWPTAIYWTQVSIGTPPLLFPVAIDSGSGDLDVGGKGCDGCTTSAPNRPYDHAQSSTSKPAAPFAFSNSYQTCDLQDPTAVCTISGKLYSDEVTLAGLGPVTVTLGSIEKQTTNFDQFKEIDGVMGFTMGSRENVFATLVKEGKCDNVWSICMVEGSTSNGTLTVGGVDHRLHTDNISYVPDSGLGFHSVKVAALNIGDNNSSATASIQVGESAILDTGTNVLLLPSHVLTAAQQAICVGDIASTCHDLFNGKCLPMTEEEIAAFPDMSLQLENDVSLQMSSKDYLLTGSPQASHAGDVCLGLRDGGSAGGSGFIIGDTTMRNYYLVFDLEEKKIGWGPVNREVCGSV